jgi:hypothetical protein
MKKNTRLLLLILLGVAFVNVDVKGQDTNVATNTLSLGIPEVALLKSSSGIINLTLTQREAGLPIETSKADSTARLRISSVITSSPRTLSAKITSGTVPTGTTLKLQVRQPNVSFVGTSGTMGAEVVLDNTDRPLVTGIGTCYSGTAASDGFPLKFTYSLDTNPATYGQLRATAGVQIVVTLTLTAAQ